MKQSYVEDLDEVIKKVSLEKENNELKLKKIEEKEPSQLPTNPLVFGAMEIGLIDKQGLFEISIDHDNSGSVAYSYITTEEAKKLIAFLQAQINS